ncbi:MAG: DUF1722 domain-containing protein [Gammaproteobacteria bacterium]|nr:DUF1722 domain-containing protein [Gammaproteobacteria bacterium]
MLQDRWKGEPGKITVGISSCLLGEEVRYDGGHKYNQIIVDTLSEYFIFLPFCPEVDIGLGIPREPIQLIVDGDITRCVGTKTTSLDVTEKLSSSADNQREWQRDISGYILKKGSPSCGMEQVKLLQDGKVEGSGVGVYANRMMQNFPLLPVVEEESLEDTDLRESFIQRVFIYRRWEQLCQSELSWAGLDAFHAFHKPIFMHHDQALTLNLGRELSESVATDINAYATGYITRMMSILKSH